MTSYPESIPFTKVAAFLRSIGLDPEDLRYVRFGMDSIEVQVARRADNGVYLMAGDDLATITATIDYQR